MNFSRRNMPFSGKFHWRTSAPAVIYPVGEYVQIREYGEPKMAWKAPKIVEVPCGMEINMYVSATRK